MFSKPAHLLELSEAAPDPTIDNAHNLARLVFSFRPYSMEVDVKLSEVSLVLCNDKPNSFGAPDVLQVGRGLGGSVPGGWPGMRR